MLLLVIILLILIFLLIFYYLYNIYKKRTNNIIKQNNYLTLSQDVTYPNYVYVIIDIVIQDLDISDEIPYGYTGIGFIGKEYNNYSQPYIPSGEPGATGLYRPSNDVQEDIGGNTIWLLAKYAYLPINSPIPVLTAIQSVYWGNWLSGWNVNIPNGFIAAKNSPKTSNIGNVPQGAFSGLPGTTFTCSRQGLCVQYKPLNTLSSFISSVAISTDTTSKVSSTSAYINGQYTSISKYISPIQDIHQSCGGNYYYMVWGETTKPITLPSGWYNISTSGTFYLGVTNQTLAVTDSSYINKDYPFKNLWYYRPLTNSLSSIAYKTSISFSDTECNYSIITVNSNVYKSGELIWPKSLMYFPGCNFYGQVSILKSGILNPLKASTIPTTWSVLNKSVPSLPYTGNINTGWYCFTTLNGQYIVWIDENMNIQMQSKTIDPSLNITRWYYSTDKRISTIIKDKKYYWPKITVPINNGLNNDWNDIVIKLTSDYSKSGTWDIFTINSNDPVWTYKPNGFGNNTVFLRHSYLSEQSVYIVFNSSVIKTVMYPSPESIFDILSTVNIIYLPAPSLPSINTGNYVFEIQKDNKCLTSSGNWSECNINNAWKYDSNLGTIKSYQNNNVCIYSKLDSNCEGDTNLATGDCGLATKFIISKDGKLYDTKCQICYSPKL